MFFQQILRFTFILFWIFNCSIGKNELPSFAGTPECKLEELPIFVQPENDIVDGNPLEVVYCSARETPSGKRIELSLVFQDERHPALWKDFVYRIYRKFRYGRSKDIESLRLQFSQTGEWTAIHLKNVYAGEQVFASDPVEHFDSILKPGSVELEEKRPVLYVNTWNHMFSEKNRNPSLSPKKLKNYEIRFGTREDLDGFYGGK
ncbi:hypothetical protein A0128_11710 [Leptospira tipperaryensis]|uniref:Uncharacterized protein n=1 Tax=Leptospira tipperaryensis TaxID=2564040 RepID=A0A1D7UY05_9LEPT|nr:hypothetical protein [Leptospira tipperaryensis]AOP34455.1 hypothetical protein A0128_11710 [Leptospira tipperaryensis]